MVGLIDRNIAKTISHQMYLFLARKHCKNIARIIPSKT